MWPWPGGSSLTQELVRLTPWLDQTISSWVEPEARHDEADTSFAPVGFRDNTHSGQQNKTQSKCILRHEESILVQEAHLYRWEHNARELGQEEFLRVLVFFPFSL